MKMKMMMVVEVMMSVPLEYFDSDDDGDAAHDDGDINEDVDDDDVDDVVHDDGGDEDPKL